MTQSADIMPFETPVHSSGNAGRSTLLSLFLITGSMVGMYLFLTCGSLIPLFDPASMDRVSFLSFFRENFWNLAFLAFLSISPVGYLILPAAFFFRGFMISSGMALLLRGGLTLLPAAAYVLIPSFFSFSALFLAGDDALAASFSLRGAPDGELSSLRMISGKTFFFSLFLIFCASFLHAVLFSVCL